jgi:hypothetical protein
MYYLSTNINSYSKSLIPSKSLQMILYTIYCYNYRVILMTQDQMEIIFIMYSIQPFRVNVVRSQTTLWRSNAVNLIANHLCTIRIENKSSQVDSATGTFTMYNRFYNNTNNNRIYVIVQIEICNILHTICKT